MNWLTHRFFYVPATAAVCTVLWNLYVVTHNGGEVTGRVVLGDAPASTATVVFYERSMTTGFAERSRVPVNAQGEFRVEGNRSHMIQIEAIMPDGTRSARRTIRLWFRAQNVRVDPALVIAPKT